MVAKIDVRKLSAGSYAVRVIEGKSESTHRVTLKDRDYAHLTNGTVTAEELIRRSFEFLLERESKESILESFDITVISRYFPQYEREIKERIEST
ncbi:MAG TPA: hypothetical protein VJN69_01910 [Candidatus Acidoferrales bacterium]|nr:hypothetical protein [Candidatus Acidoferrales bacterium]